MHRFLLWSVLALLLSIDTVSAQAPGGFARLGFGARGVALGNALVADPSASPYYNPALAPFVARQRLDASVALLSFNRSTQYLQFVTPLQRAGLAVGLVHASVSDIDGRDSNGYHTGNLSVDEYAGFLAFGLQFSERVTAGLGLQLFRSDLYEGLGAQNTIGLDIGVSVGLTAATRLGLVFDDLLARYSWDTSGLYGSGGKTTGDRFPRRIRMGASHRMMENRLTLLLEAEQRTENVEYRTSRISVLGGEPVALGDAERLTLASRLLRTGAAYRLTPEFELRAGLDRTLGAEGGAFRPGAGLSIAQQIGSLTARFDYAFVSEPYDAGNAHYISLQLVIDE